MQALILVGGEGTRLRPLTSAAPKPVVQLVDRPFMAYMLEWLARHGVDRVVMSCGYKPEGIRAVLGDGSAYGVAVEYVEEPSPMGTGGAAKYCSHLLEDEFLMLNGDVLTDIDISAQIEQHRSTGARGTLALYPVEDPSAYGVAELEPDQRIKQFIEKPAPGTTTAREISAGIYVLRKEILDLLEEGKPASIERDVWPALVGNGLYGYVAQNAYWMDIGTPDRYLDASFDIVTGTVSTDVAGRVGVGGVFVADGVSVDGVTINAPALVEAGAVLAPGCVIGPRAFVGPNVSVGAQSTLTNTVLLEGASVGAGCVLSDAVVAEGASVGDGSELSAETMIGRGASIGARNLLGSGARIFPDVAIPDAAIKV